MSTITCKRMVDHIKYDEIERYLNADEDCIAEDDLIFYESFDDRLNTCDVCCERFRAYTLLSPTIEPEERKVVEKNVDVTVHPILDIAKRYVFSEGRCISIPNPYVTLLDRTLSCNDSEGDYTSAIECIINHGNFELDIRLSPSEEYRNKCVLKIAGESVELNGCQVNLTLNDRLFVGTFEKIGKNRFVCEDYLELCFSDLGDEIKISNFIIQ